MPTYADVCRRMLTCADIGRHARCAHTCHVVRMLTCADVCYAGVCVHTFRMPAYADACYAGVSIHFMSGEQFAAGKGAAILAVRVRGCISA
jgi:hypothetical protein